MTRFLIALWFTPNVLIQIATAGKIYFFGIKYDTSSTENFQLYYVKSLLQPFPQREIKNDASRIGLIAPPELETMEASKPGFSIP